MFCHPRLDIEPLCVKGPELSRTSATDVENQLSKASNY